MDRKSNDPFSLHRVFPLLLAASTAIWGGWYIARHPGDLVKIKSIASEWLVILFALATVKIGFMGLFTKFVVSALGAELEFLEWFGITAMSVMANYLTPFRGGAAVRAVYLKMHHQIPYSFFLSSLSALYVVSLIINATLGLLAEIFLRLRYGVFDVFPILLFSLLVLLSPIALFALVRHAPYLLKRWTSREKGTQNSGMGSACIVQRGIEIVERVVEGWQLISGRPANLLRLICASLLNAGATLLMIQTVFIALDVHLRLPESLVLSSIYMISSLIPLTPSGLGIAEAAVVMTSQSWGVQGVLGVLSAGLNRAVMMLTGILWGTLFTYVLGQRTVGVFAEDSEDD